MSELVEFLPWPKTPRLNREVVVTEKIDGTNAAVIVSRDVPYGYGDGEFVAGGTVVNLAAIDAAPNENVAWDPVLVAAQSRKRVITPYDDNFGFAKWVADNAYDLAFDLGEGYHFGEWYGSGIQRGYGLEKGDKRFMLFNVGRWDGSRDYLAERYQGEVEVSTVLYRGPFDTEVINFYADRLREEGSQHVSGFDCPEGIIAFHVAANSGFKVLLEGDEIPKGLAA